MTETLKKDAYDLPDFGIFFCVIYVLSPVLLYKCRALKQTEEGAAEPITWRYHMITTFA